MNDDFGSGRKPCGSWFAQYSFTLGIIYGIAILVTVINIILQKVLYSMASFERPHNITLQLASIASKSWVLFFVQYALVLVVINAYYSRIPLPENFPFLRGLYGDFTPDWYVSVGATLMISMITNAILTPLLYLMDPVLACCTRCVDRGCAWHSSKTAQILQYAYEQIYIGPDFLVSQRYALIIGTTWFAMMYSTAMPLMYPASALCFFLTYWIDKYLFVRFYRTPPLIGLNLAQSSQSAMEWSIVLHLLVGVYLVSCPEIYSFDDSDKVQWPLLVKYSELVSSWYEYLIGTLPNRVKQLHTITMLTGMFIFFACFLLERFFGVFSRLVHLMCCCIDRQERDSKKLGFSTNFLKELTIDDLYHEY